MTTPTPDSGTENGGRPRLAPRPLWRPTVDRREAETFGRPGGVPGSFAPAASLAPRVTAAPVVPEMLADAFGRPAPDAPGLIRPPEPVPQLAPEEPGDPWRDPQAAVRLGPPAQDEPATEKAQPATAQKFTLRQALFERRLRPSAVIGMLVAALLVGAIGGVV